MEVKKSRLLCILISVVVSANAIVPGSASANEINQLQRKRDLRAGGSLYPQATETRDLKTLDGIWNFRKSPLDPEYGYRNGWFEVDLEKVNIFMYVKISNKQQL